MLICAFHFWFTAKVQMSHVFRKDYQSKSYKWEHVTIRREREKKITTAYMPLSWENHITKKKWEREKKKKKNSFSSQYLYVQFKCVSFQNGKIKRRYLHDVFVGFALSRWERTSEWSRRLHAVPSFMFDSILKFVRI